ncbi:MAG: glutathione S-transferase family protein [Alphaproteobacteria bacterium]|nr:MAG: glutathione S-transferase family protein [Alphaproteobacteria bacterium]
MGMLVNGVWHDEDPSTTGSDGSFVRLESEFRDRVTRDGSSGFKAEAGRYYLVTAPSCPWAHRTVLMRKLKGLEDTIPILQSDLAKGQGWAYSRGFDDLRPVDGVFHVHQVYSAARPDFTGRATVPVLWDRETRTIVNNESSEIIRMLNSEFDEFGKTALDLYPAALRSEIDETNAFVYDAINNGVYRCGFARTQAAYEQSFRKLFAALDSLEERLGRQRYLVGDRFTEADLRLFPTLVRFDAVYYSHFKCNLRRLADYHNLTNYTRDIYQMPGVAETVDIPRIKLGYYGGMRNLNPNGIIPLGPELDFSAPHDRGRLAKAA